MLIYPLVLIVAILFTLGGQLALKTAMVNLGEFSFSLSSLFPLLLRFIKQIWVWLSVISFGFGFLTYSYVLSKLQLNVAYPILVGSGVFLTAITSWLLFEEKLSILQVAGLFLILLGIILVFSQQNV